MEMGVIGDASDPGPGDDEGTLDINRSYVVHYVQGMLHIETGPR